MKAGMFMSFVSSPAYDSARLKTRSTLLLASAKSVVSRPSSSMYDGSCPSFVSAWKTSSRSNFGRFRRRRTVVSSSSVSFAPGYSSVSPHTSYRMPIFITTNWYRYILRQFALFSVLALRDAPRGEEIHHQRRDVDRQLHDLLALPILVDDQSELVDFARDRFDQRLHQRSSRASPVTDFVDDFFSMLRDDFRCFAAPVFGDIVGGQEDVVEVDIQCEVGDDLRLIGRVAL